jgi:hypothetical protein
VGFTEANIYNLLHKASKAVFPKDADMLVTNPATMGPQQPKPDPEMLKIQLAAHKAEMGDSQKRDKMQLDAFLEQMRQKLEADKTHFQAMVDSNSDEGPLMCGNGAGVMPFQSGGAVNTATSLLGGRNTSPGFLTSC